MTTADLAAVDSDPAVRARIALQLGGITEAYGTIDALVERLSGRPMVGVFGPAFADHEGLTEIEKLVRDHPEVGAVLLSDEDSADLYRDALRSGVRDVLPVRVETAQLMESVSRVALTLGPAPRRPVEPSAPPTALGRVVTVFSTKGGSGKSVLAVNLAVLLAQRSDQPVVLIDADLQFGDAAVMLRLTPEHTVAEAVSSIDRLDTVALQGLLLRHAESGVLVLPGPLDPAVADQIRARDLVQVVELARSLAAYVVVDTAAYFNDAVLSVLELSDEILLVVGMDIPSIKNARIGLQTLRLLDIPQTKLRLVLNRANSKVKLDVDEVERALELRAHALVPSDIAVPQSVNKGTPVVLDSPRSSVSKALRKLADTLR
jgi:pilus assembly protein CpaE